MCFQKKLTLKKYLLYKYRASIYLFINNKELTREVSLKGLGFISLLSTEFFSIN